MKRIIAVSVLATLVAVSAQAQSQGNPNTGLQAAGSNFTGPGGGGGGASGTVGAFLPAIGGTAGGFSPSTGMPGGSTGGFSNPTGAVQVQVGGLSVAVSPPAQQAAAGAIVSGNVAGFTNSLGNAVPGPAATALGNSLAALGDGARGGNFVAFAVALQNAIAAFNAAVNAMAPGTPVPQSLIAARALIAGYYQ